MHIISNTPLPIPHAVASTWRLHISKNHTTPPENTMENQQHPEEQAKRGRGRPRKEEKQYGSVCIYINSEAIKNYGSIENAKRTIRHLVCALLQAPNATAQPKPKP